MGEPDLSAQNQTLRALLEACDTVKDQADLALADLTGRLEAAAGSIVNLQGQVTDLTAALGKEQSDHDATKGRYQTLAAESTGKDGLIAEVRGELADVRATLGELPKTLAGRIRADADSRDRDAYDNVVATLNHAAALVVAPQ